MTRRPTPGERARVSEQMAREMDRAAIMAEVRASIARISRAAAQPGVFVLPVARDASALRGQLDAIAADRALDACTTREEPADV